MCSTRTTWTAGKLFTSRSSRPTRKRPRGLRRARSTSALKYPPAVHTMCSSRTVRVRISSLPTTFTSSSTRDGGGISTWTSLCINPGLLSQTNGTVQSRRSQSKRLLPRRRTFVLSTMRCLWKSNPLRMEMNCALAMCSAMSRTTMRRLSCGE